MAVLGQGQGEAAAGTDLLVHAADTKRGGPGNGYGTHLQEGDYNGDDDEKAAKPYMYGCKLGRLLCPFVDAVVDEPKEKLGNHE